MRWSELFSVTPERLCSRDASRLLAVVYQNGQLTRLVVDEVSSLSVV